ncbi:MAG: hypothetical protein AMXMBFR13_47140 [Phycisphaerae bacterium]|jgi:PIN domain nuclease of toxin-antitoxin system
MNGYLLDTHVVLWWLADPKLLTEAARTVIGNGANSVYMSVVAAWEMAIKKASGRLDIPGNLSEVLAADNIKVLGLSLDHALGVADLPVLHHDPFDRMQVVQAQLEDLTLITRDERIQQYAVKWLGA